MTISHVHPMFLLILSLFFLPTSLAIPFQDCGHASYPIKVTGVDKLPGGFSITCSTNKVLPGGFVDLKVKFRRILVIKHRYTLSQLITCPVSPGAFVLRFVSLFAPVVIGPMEISVTILGGPDNADEIMCLQFHYQ